MNRSLHHLKIAIVLWGVLLACSGRIAPNLPDEEGFVVLNSTPANGALNVQSGTRTTISVTFSAPVDTSIFGFLMAPVPTEFDSVFDLSADGKTVNVGARLQANTAYTAVIYTAKDKSGAALSAPFQVSFATGNSFPTGRVQGVANIRAGGPPPSPKGTLVGLLKISLPEVILEVFRGKDALEVLRANLQALTVVTEDNGNYSINNVPGGRYFPAAIKDVDGDASLQPAPLGNDALGFYNNPSFPDTTAGAEDSVRVISGQTLANINIRQLRF